MIIVASRGRVISDRADTEGRHFRVADVDRALAVDNISVSAMALAQ